MTEQVFAISITANGVTVWQAGTWPTMAEAVAWMDEHDEALADIEIDIAKEWAEGGDGSMPEVETTITYINTPQGLGWGAGA